MFSAPLFGNGKGKGTQNSSRASLPQSSSSGWEAKIPWHHIHVRSLTSSRELLSELGDYRKNKIARLYHEFQQTLLELPGPSRSERTPCPLTSIEKEGGWLPDRSTKYITGDGTIPGSAEGRTKWYQLYSQGESHVIELLEGFRTSATTVGGGVRGAGTASNAESSSAAPEQELKRHAFAAYRVIQHMQNHVRRLVKADRRKGFHFMLLAADHLKPNKWNDTAFELMFELFEQEIGRLNDNRTSKQLKCALWHEVLNGNRRETDLTLSQKREFEIETQRSKGDGKHFRIHAETHQEGRKVATEWAKKRYEEKRKAAKEEEQRKKKAEEKSEKARRRKERLTNELMPLLQQFGLPVPLGSGEGRGHRPQGGGSDDSTPRALSLANLENSSTETLTQKNYEHSKDRKEHEQAK